MKFIDFIKQKMSAKPKKDGLQKVVTADNQVAPKRIALCLGGGGARGFAHIGALKAFEEAGLDFDLVVGTSAGSLVGALYAAKISAREIENFASGINMRDVHNGIILTPNDPNKIGRLVTNILGDADFSSLKKRFACVAVDLVEAKQIVIDSGKIGDAVSASCAVPLFFRPLILGERHLVDGGLLNNIPADVCRMLGATAVVTVDINPTRGGGTAELGIIDVIKATFSIMGANSSINGLRASDVIIAPDLSKFKATSKDGFEEMIQLGYDSAKAKINQIKSLFI